MNNTGPFWNFQQNTGNSGQQNLYNPITVPQPVWNRPAYPMLAGKIINSLQDVRPNEIPTDGSPSLFPASDFSCIFVKAWGQDGNIQTVKYVPENQNQQSSNEFNLLMAKLNELEEFLQSNGQRNNPQQNRRPNKEGGNNQ